MNAVRAELKILVRSPTRMIAPSPCFAYGCCAQHSVTITRSVGFSNSPDFTAPIAPMNPSSSPRVSSTATVDSDGFRCSRSSIVSTAAAPARLSQTRLRNRRPLNFAGPTSHMPTQPGFTARQTITVAPSGCASFPVVWKLSTRPTTSRSSSKNRTRLPTKNSFRTPPRNAQRRMF